LFQRHSDAVQLPREYGPARAPYFDVQRIYLARGSLATADRREFVEGICSLHPEAEVIERLGTPHSRIKLDQPDPLLRHRAGKHTIVFGELKSAVRFSEESGNTCPNYWHFSPYGFCPFGCKYCYLAGTRGVWFSPTVKIYVNLPDMLAEIGRIAERIGHPTAFYLGKLQDGLALDPLTGFSTILAPFFAEHGYARQVILTKSGNVERLLSLNHGGHTILSWSVNPPEIAEAFEANVPSTEERLEAMVLCAAKGYPVRAVLMPIIPVDGWADVYRRFIHRLLDQVPVQRLTIGGICSYRNARFLMERKIGSDNVISRHLDKNCTAGDGRMRYSRQLRKHLYSHVIGAAREVRPGIALALCLEERELWESLGLADSIGRCNCVL